MDAEEIVRKLAAVEDPCILDRDYQTPDCGLCFANDVRLNLPRTHDENCPWRLAREWVEATDGE